MATSMKSALAAVSSPIHPSASTDARAASMRAIAHPQYGGAEHLQLAHVPVPVVGKGQVLVRVQAAAVNKGDWHVMTGMPYLIRAAGYGLRRPKHPVLGQELAGRVEAVGADVTTFQPGDEVYGEIVAGAFAEYALASVDEISLKPTNLSFAEAAAIPSSGLTALKGLRDVADVQPGQRVLINGASGGVGTFAVQLAHFFGAEVTGVCSGRNVEMVRSLGADHVIDYQTTDFTEGDARYDVMFDLVGNRSLKECRRILTKKGMYISSAGQGGDWLGPMGRIFKTMLTSLFVSQTMTFLAPPDKRGLTYLRGLLEAGDVAPVIGRRCTLDEVPEAMTYQGTGRAQGKTVVTL